MLTGKPVVWDKPHKDGFLYPNLSIFFSIHMGRTWVTSATYHLQHIASDAALNLL